MHTGEVIVPIVFFALVFGIVYIALNARNKERMALIDKGADASIFYSEKKKGSGKWLIQLGIVVMGIALGVLAGAGLDSAGLEGEIAMPSAIFFFAGIGLVVAYFLGRRVNGDS